MLKRKIISWFTGCVLLVCNDVAVADTAPLRVAIGTDNPPLAFVSDGKPVGIEMDMSRLLQAELGVKLQIRQMPSSELIAALERGEVDIVMGGLLEKPELQQRVLFVPPYLHSGEMAIIRTDDVMRFHSPAALLAQGIKVGAITGSDGERYVSTNMAGAKLTTCAGRDECLQALLTHQFDVFIGSPAISWSIATDSRYGALMSLNRPLNEEFFAWAVAKNNAALKERLEDALDRMQHLQMYEHILNRWIPVRAQSD